MSNQELSFIPEECYSKDDRSKHFVKQKVCQYNVPTLNRILITKYFLYEKIKVSLILILFSNTLSSSLHFLHASTSVAHKEFGLLFQSRACREVDTMLLMIKKYKVTEKD